MVEASLIVLMADKSFHGQSFKKDRSPHSCEIATRRTWTRTSDAQMHCAPQSTHLLSIDIAFHRYCLKTKACKIVQRHGDHSTFGAPSILLLGSDITALEEDLIFPRPALFFANCILACPVLSYPVMSSHLLNPTLQLHARTSLTNRASTTTLDVIV